MTTGTEKKVKIAHFEPPVGELTDLLIPELLANSRYYCYLEGPFKDSKNKLIIYDIAFGDNGLDTKITGSKGVLLPGEYPELVHLYSDNYREFMKLYEKLKEKGYSLSGDHKPVLAVDFRINLKNPGKRVIEASMHSARVMAGQKYFPFDRYVKALKSKSMTLKRIK